MRTSRSAKPAPTRSSPYPKRERTKSARITPATTSKPVEPAPASPPRRRKSKKPDVVSVPPPILNSPLFKGVNPVYLARAMRSIARGNYADAHGFLHLCVVQARNAAAERGRVSSLVVCLLMLYSDNWLRLGVPSKAVAYMEDALIAQEQIGDETDEDRRLAAEAGLELRQFMQPKKREVNTDQSDS